jgi:hypothetical protein
MVVFLKRIVLLLIFGTFLNCEDNSSKKGAISNFVPENVSIVLKFSTEPDPSASFKNFNRALKNNQLLSSFIKNKPYSDLWKKTALLKNLNPIETSLLCISKVNDSTAAYTFITEVTSNVLNTDSIANTIIDTLLIGEKSIQRITIDNQVAYVASQDSVFIASSSKNVIEDILNGKTENDLDFQKLLAIKSDSDFTALIRDQEVKISDSTEVSFASWTNLNIAVLRDGISATGVALARDTIPQVLSVFEGQIPQQNDIASIVPTMALEARSFTFNDAEALLLNLKKLNKKSNLASTTNLFGTVNEIGEISFSEGKAIFIKSIDPALTEDALARYISEKDSFREITLSTFSEPELFEGTFAPFIDNIRPILLFQLDNFFVFSESETIAQQIITAYINKNCLNNTSYFEKHTSQLSSASSLLILKMQGQVPTSLSGFLGFDEQENKDVIRSKKYPIAALQYSYDRDFAHVNFISREGSVKRQTSGRVSQDFSIKLKNELLGDPQFFSNHRSKEKDILVQDVTNTLHLINPDGKIIWNQKIDGPLLGKINEVDILRNGKKQMAFTTKNTLYVLDRNGKDVSPFPIKFKDPITQPLSVFDYDKNRKYRFIITQGKEIYMYDSKGKTVKGFSFKKAKSKIVLPPQHFQLGNKDYIAIAEENGNLNLLSRRGKSRINVQKKFKFSEIPIAKEGSKFVVITVDNKKERISQSGKVTSLSLDVSSNYSFSIKGTTKVTLDDNLLRIKGKLVELPFGIYTKPQLFFANRTIYISITETQENKVYLYGSAGSLINGFPVFGTSVASIANSSKKGGLKIVVRGEKNEIIEYSLR